MNSDVVFADRVVDATISLGAEHSVCLATRARPGDSGWMLALGLDQRVIGLEVVKGSTGGVGSHLFMSVGIVSRSTRTGQSRAGWLDSAVAALTMKQRDILWNDEDPVPERMRA